ncbi:UNVERIFIED_ORG: hypothetical protein ABIC97_005496 [Peribacillus simplex]
MKNLIISIIVLLVLWLVLPLFNINSSYLIPNVIEWATKFILPWIVLYWFIRLIRNLEKI